MSNREDYEAQVRGLRTEAAAMTFAGAAVEEVARALVLRRNALKVAARQLDPPAIVALIEQRNTLKYGNPIGPDADQLFDRYGNWDAVIDAACRHAFFGG